MLDAAVMVMLAPVLSPHGVLTLVRSLEADAAPVPEVERGVRLEQAFAHGSGHGLLVLGADEVGTTLSPTLSFWRKFGARYVTALCSLPGIGERSKPPVPIPADGELARMTAAVPPMTGAEYLTTEVLAHLWRERLGSLPVEGGPQAWCGSRRVFGIPSRRTRDRQAHQGCERRQLPARFG
jgi:hypothetical protein